MTIYSEVKKIVIFLLIPISKPSSSVSVASHSGNGTVYLYQG